MQHNGGNSYNIKMLLFSCKLLCISTFFFFFLTKAFRFYFCCCTTADSFCVKITVILPLVIHYPQPCGAVFIVKILSHIATAAPIHLMSGFEEQLKALLQQLRVFDVGELDIPPDLEHSPRINTVVWRLTCRALYSLNAEIHTASMEVPLSLFSPPRPSFIHCFLSLSHSSSFCNFVRCGGVRSLSPSVLPSSSLLLLSSFSVPFHLRRSI